MSGDSAMNIPKRVPTIMARPLLCRPPAPEIRHAAWRLLAASRLAALTPRCPKISLQTVRPAPMSPMKLYLFFKEEAPMRIAAKG